MAVCKLLIHTLLCPLLLQTVVLCHPSGPVVEQQEEEFWHCAKRVNNALKTDMVLPGGGYAENACVDILQNMTGILWYCSYWDITDLTA